MTWEGVGQTFLSVIEAVTIPRLFGPDEVVSSMEVVYVLTTLMFIIHFICELSTWASYPNFERREIIIYDHLIGVGLAILIPIVTIILCYQVDFIAGWFLYVVQMFIRGIQIDNKKYNSAFGLHHSIQVYFQNYEKYMDKIKHYAQCYEEARREFSNLKL